MPRHIAIDLAQAQRMREGGASWDDVGEAFGITGETMHRKLDPAYAKRCRDQIDEVRRGHKSQRPQGDGSGYRAGGSDPEIDAALRLIPTDTRTWQQRLFGDPPAERSALARRQAR